MLLHDGVVLGLGKVDVDQDASVAAQAAATRWSVTDNVQDAYNAAASAVAANGTDIETSTFHVDQASGTVTLTADRTTSTMIAYHFHWFDALTHPTATASSTAQQQQ